MEDNRVSILSTIADLYLKNPFFILDSSNAKDPLLHQTETLARSFFLKPTRILVADVIGLGKTVTALRILKMLKLYGEISKVLIIIPSVLLPQWYEELKYFGVIPITIERIKLRKLSIHEKLPPGEVYIVTLDRLKRPEYFRLIEKENWDLIIVDEAQKLGYVGGKPTQRMDVVGNFIARLKAANVVLLSATPHKGYDYDYVARLYLVDPSLSNSSSAEALKELSSKLVQSFYEATHNVIVHRRTKADINNVYEQREVFKKCYMLAILIKPGDHEKEMLSNLTKVGEKELEKYYNEIAKKGYIDPAMVRGVVRLLRKIIVKRGLSSPRALVKTFGKVIRKREEILSRLEKNEGGLEEIEKIVNEKIPEFEEKLEKALDPEAEPDEEVTKPGKISKKEKEVEEPDEIFNEIVKGVGKILPGEYVRLTKEAISIAEEIEQGKLPDSKLETLKKLIDETFREHDGRFKDLYGAKIVVFTEFKDTAEYVYGKLREWLRSRYGERADGMIKLVTSENRGQYEDIARWFRENSLAKILVTTDVLGEGLNLQVANVLVNYEVTYSPVRLEQRIGRIWRYGQKKDSYVFNLFYMHEFEKEVATSIFGKLYGINEAVGGQELTLGDEVFMSTIGDSLFEKIIRERLGKEYDGYSRYLGGLIPVVVNHKGREVRLTDSAIIDALFEGELDTLLEEFVEAIVDLARKIREKGIYPKPLERKDIEEFLEQSFGIRNYDEARYIADKLVEAYTTLSKSPVSLAESTRFDVKLNQIRSKGRILDPGSTRLFFALPYDEKTLFVLAVASITVSSKLGRRVYKEPILVKLNLDKKSADIYRGKMLVDKLTTLLQYAIEVDEVYNADKLVEDEWNKALNYVKSRLQNNYLSTAIGYNDMTYRIKRYEEEKKSIGASGFFDCTVEVTDIQQLGFFISSGILPESTAVPSTNVWFGFESQYLRDVVLRYEEEKGRKASIKEREEEHYDVYSYSNDGEERYIEAKGFTKPRLEIRLTDMEYQKAVELGDKYWLYLVYGVGTANPVILCIRNPANKIELLEISDIIIRKQHVWSKKMPDEI